MFKVIGDSNIYGDGQEAQCRAEELGLEPLDVVVELDDVEVDGIDTSDYPDFADAFISWGVWSDGTDLTDDELDILNEDGDFVYSAVERSIY